MQRDRFWHFGWWPNTTGTSQLLSKKRTMGSRIVLYLLPSMTHTISLNTVFRPMLCFASHAVISRRPLPTKT